MEFHAGGDFLSLLDKFGHRLEEKAIRFYVAEIVLGLTTRPLILIHRHLSLDDISMVTILKKPLQDEWCVGWMLFINDLKDVSYILRMIRLRHFEMDYFTLN